MSQRLIDAPSDWLEHKKVGSDCLLVVKLTCLKVHLRLSRKAASLEDVGLLMMLRGDQCDVHPPQKLLERHLFQRKLVSVNSGVRCWIKTIESLLAESG